MSEQLTTTPSCISERDLSRRLAVSVRTVQRWREVGEGPSYVKFGRAVRYHPGEVERWLGERVRRSTSDPGSRRRSAE
jgi:predicted DNA-binding transcriptional regulator AlpA